MNYVPLSIPCDGSFQRWTAEASGRWPRRRTPPCSSLRRPGQARRVAWYAMRNWFHEFLALMMLFMPCLLAAILLAVALDEIE